VKEPPCTRFSVSLGLVPHRPSRQRDKGATTWRLERARLGSALLWLAFTASASGCGVTALPSSAPSSAPPESTTAPPESTTAPPESTTAPPESTTALPDPQNDGGSTSNGSGSSPEKSQTRSPQPSYDRGAPTGVPFYSVPGPIGGGDIELTPITSRVALDAGDVQLDEQVEAYFQAGRIGNPPVNRIVRVVGPNSEDFHLSSRLCDSYSCDSGSFLCPDERCWFWVTFAPSEVGRRTAALEIGSTGYELTGVGVSGTRSNASSEPGSEAPEPSSSSYQSTPSPGTDPEPTLSSSAESSAPTD
jgi:hypothetical protein